MVVAVQELSRLAMVGLAAAEEVPNLPVAMAGQVAVVVAHLPRPAALVAFSLE